MRIRPEVKNLKLVRSIVLVMMRKGELLKSANLFSKILFSLRVDYKVKFPLAFIQLAIENVRPKVFFKRKKVAGRAVLIPLFLEESISYMVGIRRLVSSARELSGMSFTKAFILSILNAASLKGKDVQWRRDLHKLALDSRANIRYIKR